MTVPYESMNRKKSPCVSDCHARSLRGCKSVLLFFCILRAKRGCCGVIVVGKGNVASNVFVYTKTLFALQNACWGSAPNPFDLHFPMQATPPCGMLLRVSISTSYEKSDSFLAQGSIKEFDGSWYNSRRCVLCGLHTNKVKRSC